MALYHVALYDDVFVPVLKTYFPTLGQGRVQGAGQHLESQMQPGSTENEAEAKQLGEEGTVVIAEGTKVCVSTWQMFDLGGNTLDTVIRVIQWQF